MVHTQLLREKVLTRKTILLLALVLFSLAGLFIAKDSIVGYLFLEQQNIVTFAIQPEWNLSDGLVRISQDTYVYDETNLTALVEGSDIVVHLDTYNLTTGDVYVDLIISGTLVESEHVSYVKKESAPAPDIAVQENTTNEPVVLTQESSASTEAYSGWFQGNSTGTLQVDHVIVEPKIPYINNTLNCSNGSVSTDVSSLLYLWYVNETSLKYDNRSTLGTGNFTTHDQIDCAIAPQNGTNLLAYWAFDEGRGGSVYELVNNNSGTYINATWARGRDFYAVNLSASQNISIRNTTYAINASREFTHEMWIMPKTTGSGDVYRLGYFRIYITNSAVDVDFPDAGGTSSTQTLNSTATLQQNVWTHVAVTYNNTLLSLYINGALDNTTRVTGNLNAYAGNVSFGEGYGATFVTYLDEYAIYNRSLSREEIIDQFRNGIGKQSRQMTTEVDTTQDQFANGTKANTDVSGQAGNITLSGTNLNGNFTSRILELPNGQRDAILKFTNVTLAGHNISLQTRSGVASSHGGVNWSEFSGPDPTHSRDSSLFFALDFSKRTENTTTDLISGQVVGMDDMDFMPAGKHGFGVQMYGNGGLQVSDFPQLSLNATNENYSIELWVNPLQRNNRLIFDKGDQYFLYLNTSGNAVFNATFGTNQTTISSISILPTNTWTHIVVTHNSDNLTRLYINGSREAQQFGNGTINLSTEVLRIGTSAGFSNFNGTVDSFAMYNRTLDDGIVRQRSDDLFVNSTGGEYAGDVNRFIQYRVFFERNEVSGSSILQDVSIRVHNYTTFIYDHNPRNTSLDAPLNNTIVTTTQNFNWTTATDLENDTLMYEFIISNGSDFNPVVISRLAVNNFSEFSLFDDNYTTLVEQFTTRKDILGHGLRVGNWTNALQQGRWGKGIVISEGGMSLRIPTPQTIGIINNKSGSIEFWVRPRWTPSDGGTNFFFDEQNKLLTMNRTGSLLTVEMGNGLNVLTYNISGWSANEWHHIGVSWNENRNFTLIVDGTRVNRTVMTPITQAFTNDFYIGSTTGPGLIFNGVIDGLRISNASRESYLDINMTNLTINPNDFADNSYYWRVRVLNYNANNSFEGELLDSSWDYRTVRLDTRTPTLNLTEIPNRVYWDINTNINLSSDEPVYCEIRSPTTSFVPLNFTGSLTHSHIINLTTIGNYTFLLNCNDTNNNFVNTTALFYAFNQSTSTGGGIRKNVTNATFTANQSQEINFTRVDGTTFARINITVRNNMTGKIGFVLHSPDDNPENSTKGNGFAGPKLRFLTFLVDEFLTRNFTDGNATINIIYDAANFSAWQPNSARLYVFNYTNSTWMILPYTINMSASATEVTFNTTYFSTYVIVGATPPPKTVSLLPSAQEGKAAHQRQQTLFTTSNLQKTKIPKEELYVGSIIAGEQNVVEVYNPYIGVLDMLVTTNTNLDNVVFYAERQEPTDSSAFKSFSISAADYVTGKSIEASVLDSLTVSYAIKKEWLEKNSYSIEDIVLMDADGNTYALTPLDEDDDFYYVESYVNAFGTFTILPGKLAPEEEAVVEEKKEEKKEKEGVEGKPSAGSIFVYTALTGFGVFYLSRIALALLFLRKRDYELAYDDLEAGDQDFSSLKWYIYQNLGNKNLEEDLRKKGIDPVVSRDLAAKIQTLGRGKLEQYVYKELSGRRSADALVQELMDSGWDEKTVRDAITAFQKI